MIWIIGGGAVGMLLAARLAGARVPVLLATRSEEQAEAVRRNGVELLERGRRTDIPVRAIGLARLREADLTAAGKPEWLLLAVKQTSLDESLCAELGRMAERTGAIAVGLQNGIGHLDKLSRHVPMRQLAAAVTTEGAKRVGIRSVEHTGTGETRIGWAKISETENPGTLESLINRLQSAGIDTRLSKDMNSDLWRKCLINAVINPLTAIYGVKNGELPRDPERLKRMRRLFEENVRAARAEGYSFDDRLWETILQVCAKTADNESSMLQDIRQGRRTEIDAINGELIARAERRGLSMEANREAVRQVKRRESGG